MYVRRMDFIQSYRELEIKRERIMKTKTLTPESLTTITQAREMLLKPLLDSYNEWRQSIGLFIIGAHDFIKKEYNCTQAEWLNRPLTPKERFKFYQLSKKIV